VSARAVEGERVDLGRVLDEARVDEGLGGGVVADAVGVGSDFFRCGGGGGDGITYSPILPVEWPTAR